MSSKPQETKQEATEAPKPTEAGSDAWTDDKRRKFETGAIRRNRRASTTIRARRLRRGVIGVCSGMEGINLCVESTFRRIATASKHGPINGERRVAVGSRTIDSRRDGYALNDRMPDLGNCIIRKETPRALYDIDIWRIY
ncbi:hypothetical protein CDV36_013633 [Fusarium kuroshium]|uniref:Uncharacterized protein n=1 Tax=Fusarium kuroshium TaxID=2010991 RepID=A0A3M2RN80_9HYPO|nr:hypothetical protein CDV36_013633 [Fusarium kuroshium]